MLRIKHNTAGKPWACEYCATPIEKGQAVQRIEPFRQPVRRRHATCPPWTNSERESNEAKSLAWQAVESLEKAKQGYLDTMGSRVEDLFEALNDGASTLREAAELHRASAENLESGGFVGTSQVDELNGWADNYDGWADEWEQLAGEYDPSIVTDDEEEDILSRIDDLVGEVDPG